MNNWEFVLGPDSKWHLRKKAKLGLALCGAHATEILVFPVNGHYLSQPELCENCAKIKMMGFE